MFRPVNFELQIDHHRVVKEYRKEEERKQSKMRKIVAIGLTATAVAVIAGLKYKKVFGF